MSAESARYACGGSVPVRAERQRERVCVCVQRAHPRDSNVRCKCTIGKLAFGGSVRCRARMISLSISASRAYLPGDAQTARA